VLQLLDRQAPKHISSLECNENGGKDGGGVRTLAMEASISVVGARIRPPTQSVLDKYGLGPF
jgi:hypothetical protein